jgi:hypothetical protein
MGTLLSYPQGATRAPRFKENRDTSRILRESFGKCPSLFDLWFALGKSNLLEALFGSQKSRFKAKKEHLY